MITGALKKQVDRGWTTFWQGGIENSLTIIGQLIDLIFAKLLHELITAEGDGGLFFEKTHITESMQDLILTRNKGADT